MSSPDHPSARDRAAEIIAKAIADDGSPIRNMTRDDALTWLQEVATSACGSQHDARAWAAARVLLSALAGAPHPGVEELAEVIDPPAFDPRGSVASPVNAYARGKRQRAALDAAGRVRALLGHTTTDTQETPA